MAFERALTIEEFINVILESDYYKKLAGKTQIIFNPYSNSDKILNRQTHTETVADVAVEIAKDLGYDEETIQLTRLTAICHDLGHTTLGHDGETVLDEKLKQINMTEFDQYYSKEYLNGKEVDMNNYRPMPKNAEAGFDHHIHSIRIINRIIEEQGIVLRPGVLEALERGVLGHSESREEPPKYKAEQIVRIADKSYVFTDLSDIKNAGFEINVDKFFEDMKDKDYFKDMIEEGYLKEKGPTKDDKEDIKKIISDLKEKDEFLEIYKKEFINDIVHESRDSEKVGPSTQMRKKMEMLKLIAKYMRKEILLEKEEDMAKAMIEEIWLYKTDKYMGEGLDPKNTPYKIADEIAGYTDEEAFKYYKGISKDEKWLLKNKNGEVDYKRKLDSKMREMLRNNPEIIRHMDIKEKQSELKRSVSQFGRMKEKVEMQKLGIIISKYESQEPKERQKTRCIIKQSILNMEKSLQHLKEVNKENKSEEKQNNLETSEGRINVTRKSNYGRMHLAKSNVER